MNMNINFKLEDLCLIRDPDDFFDFCQTQTIPFNTLVQFWICHQCNRFYLKDKLLYHSLRHSAAESYITYLFLTKIQVYYDDLDLAIVSYIIFTTNEPLLAILKKDHPTKDIFTWKNINFKSDNWTLKQRLFILEHMQKETIKNAMYEIVDFLCQTGHIFYASEILLSQFTPAEVFITESSTICFERGNSEFIQLYSQINTNYNPLQDLKVFSESLLHQTCEGIEAICAIYGTKNFNDSFERCLHSYLYVETWLKKFNKHVSSKMMFYLKRLSQGFVTKNKIRLLEIILWNDDCAIFFHDFITSFNIELNTFIRNHKLLVLIWTRIFENKSISVMFTEVFKLSENKLLSYQHQSM